MALDKSAPRGSESEGGFQPRKGVSLPAPASPSYQRLEDGADGKKTVSGGSLVLGSAFGLAILNAKPTVTRPFQENGWVHALMKEFGAAVRSVPLEIWRGDPSINKEAEVLSAKDPLVQVLAKPAPQMTQAQFLEAGLQHRKLEGEDFWVLLGDDLMPIKFTGLLRIPVPRWILSVRGNAVTIEYDTKTGWPKRYQVSVMNGERMTCEPSAIVHFRDYNPDDCRRGLGDAEAAIALVDLDHQADRYQRAILANSGDPGGYIISKGGPPAAEIKAATENQASQQHAPTEAGKYRYIDQEVEYQPYEHGPREMDFPRMREWVRDALAAIFGVPLPIIGVLDNATLANFDQSVQIFWNNVVGYLKSVEDVLNNLFLPNLDRPDAKQLVARFNTKTIKALQEDKGKQIELAIKIAESGLGASLHDGFKLAGHEVDNKIAPLAATPFSKAGTVLTQDVVDGTLPTAPAAPTDPNAGDAPADPPADDGKSGAPVEVREAAPETPPAPPAPTEAEIAAAGRREYWTGKEASLLARGEADLRVRYRNIRRQYEKATYRRIRDFAENGEQALRRAKPSTKTDDNAPPADDYRPDVSHLHLPKNEWAPKFESTLEPAIRLSWSRGLDDIFEELGRDMLLNPSDPSVVAAIRSQVTQLVDGHLDFLGERVGAALSEALSKATNQASLQEAVNEVLPEISDNLKRVFGDRPTRAATIARTETARSVNGARFAGMKQAGVNSSEWVSSHDNVVRGAPGGPNADSEFSHYSLDGKTAQIGFAFEGHPQLKYPGDPNAPVGDTANCRCVARPQITNGGDQ